MEKNIWTYLNFNTLLFLCFVVGEQRLQIFVIVHRLVVSEVMGLLCVALQIDFENLVVLVHSCVYNRLRPTEMIGFNDNSWYLSRIQM